MTTTFRTPGDVTIRAIREAVAARITIRHPYTDVYADDHIAAVWRELGGVTSSSIDIFAEITPEMEPWVDEKNAAEINALHGAIRGVIAEHVSSMEVTVTFGADND